MKNFRSIKKQGGFTMVELMFVGVILLIMGVLFAQDQARSFNIQQARNVGLQMKKISDAVNSYTYNRLVAITALNNATGGAADPGPRTCNAASSSCAITLQTLINDGLLPPGYRAAPPFNRTGYTITLKRTGAAPSWNIQALTITNSGWVDAETGAVRYDLAGEALGVIGPEGGYTFQSRTVLSGYRGTWTDTSAAYPSINAFGQVGVRSGSGTSLFSQFLRRDGTLPMTGTLNLDGNDVAAANNIGANNIGANNIEASASISTEDAAGCKKTELGVDGKIISRNAGCVTRFQTDPRIGQTVFSDVRGAQAVRIMANDPASYQTLEVRRWGIHNPEHHLYLEHGRGKNLYLTPNTWNPAHGELIANYSASRFAGDVYINGRPTPLRELLPTYASRGAYIVRNGTWVRKPTCGGTGAVPKVIITPSVMNAQIHVGGGLFWNNNGFLALARDINASWWVVTISGWPRQATTSFGMAHVYCHFVAGT